MPGELRNIHENPWPMAITSAAITGFTRLHRGSYLRAAGAAGVAAILVSGSPVRAEEAAGASSWRVQTLVAAHRFIPDEPRADPDQPSLRYGLLGGRWKAMAGAGVLLVGGESDRLRLGLALDGFIELINFDRGEPVPWESYRANVGFRLPEVLW